MRRVREEKFDYVYILTSSSRRALYTGISNDIYERVDQHRNSDDLKSFGMSEQQLPVKKRSRVGGEARKRLLSDQLILHGGT
jgi:hypothetical protein